MFEKDLDKLKVFESHLFHPTDKLMLFINTQYVKEMPFMLIVKLLMTYALWSSLMLSVD